MSKPMIRIHDTLNDEILDREMTDAEYQDYLIEQENEEQKELLRAQAAAAKAALLEKLGITEEEAKLLLA